jgi:O-antigen/teichoic acid export membrane protein
MSRSRRFLGGLWLGYASQILTMLTGLWMTPFLLRHLGQHDYGLWLVGLQLLAYLTLIDLGVVALLPRETAYATGRGGGIEGATDLPLIIGQTGRIVLWQTPIVLFAAVGAYIFMPSQWANLRYPLAWMLVAFVITFPLRIFQAVLRGLQDLKFLGAINIVTWLVTTAVTIALVWAGYALNALAVGWIIGQILSGAVHYVRLKVKFPAALPNRLPSTQWQQVRKQLTAGFWVSVAQMAQVMVNATDMLIVGRILGPSAVVPYACTGRLIMVLGNQPQMLMQAAAPGLCEMTTGASRDRLLSALTSLTQLITMASGVIVAVVLSVNSGFVDWWVGSNLYGGGALNVLLLASMFFRSFNTSYAHAVLFLGHERRLSMTNLADGAITVGSGLLLTKLFGAIGAPLGSLLGVCLVSLPMNLNLVVRETGTGLYGVLKPLTPLLTRAGLAWGAVAILSIAWKPQGIQMLALVTIAILAAFSGLILPLILRPPIRDYVVAALPPNLAKKFVAVGA